MQHAVEYIHNSATGKALTLSVAMEFGATCYRIDTQVCNWEGTSTVCSYGVWYNMLPLDVGTYIVSHYSM